MNFLVPKPRQIRQSRGSGNENRIEAHKEQAIKVMPDVGPQWHVMLTLLIEGSQQN